MRTVNFGIDIDVHPALVDLLEHIQIVHPVLDGVLHETGENLVLRAVELVDEDDSIVRNLRLIDHVAYIDYRVVPCDELVRTHEEQFLLPGIYRGIEFRHPEPIGVGFDEFQTLIVIVLQRPEFSSDKASERRLDIFPETLNRILDSGGFLPGCIGGTFNVLDCS
ncbi:hypothetical protein SDC9_105262 [bioreactor metagenome]|uniref:Uncharacterized protein n=1 Tax=bioreactor metagenome TaxID=1076179 RepID=A0A645B1J6_9ZZZZ